MFDLQQHVEGVDQLKQQVHELVDEYMNQARDHYGVHIPAVPVEFDLTGKCAGKAYYGQNKRLQFNWELLLREKDRFLSRTVPHEVAHIVSVAVYGIVEGRGHGSRWKEVMAVFGVKASRCHSYDTNNMINSRVQRRWTYRCSCRDWQLSTTRHNKIWKKGWDYRCPDCNDTLRRK